MALLGWECSLFGRNDFVHVGGRGVSGDTAFLFEGGRVQSSLMGWCSPFLGLSLTLLRMGRERVSVQSRLQHGAIMSGSTLSLWGDSATPPPPPPPSGGSRQL